MTTEQLIRGLTGERDYTDGRIAVVLERLHGIDRATDLLAEGVKKVPSEVSQAVAHLRELTETKFDGVATQFKERDTRQEREARDNKTAVDAAFAASKEAASETNKSNALAIGKSEEGTKEKIDKLEQLFKTEAKGLGEKIDDVKERMIRLELRVNSAEQNKVGGNERMTGLYAALGAVVAILTIIVMAANGVFSGGTS